LVGRPQKVYVAEVKQQHLPFQAIVESYQLPVHQAERRNSTSAQHELKQALFNHQLKLKTL
jgi:hypothetical protein